MKIWYPCEIQKDSDEKFLVTFPNFPETLTEGDTEEEALFNASEALTLTLEGWAEEGTEIPFPPQVETGHMVYPSSRSQAALLIRFSRKGKKKRILPALLAHHGLLFLTWKICTIGQP